jgi:hypothetical protein
VITPVGVPIGLLGKFVAWIGTKLGARLFLTILKPKE